MRPPVFLHLLPEFRPDGNLPIGVHTADWEEFKSRFGTQTTRRAYLIRRLEALISLAAGTGKLRRVFVWGSFVTAKPSPGDVDVLLIMADDFEVEGEGTISQPVFDFTRARLLFEADVFWARASIGQETLDVWLDTYQTSRAFEKRGIVELELP